MPSGARMQAFHTSGERDSCVEHMVHVVRLQTVESVQFPKNKTFEAPPPSSAMLNRHSRRAAEEDSRIRHENHILWEKIESQARYGEKLRRDAEAKIKKQKESYAGSNIHRRTIEARRIDRDNAIMFDRIAGASPRVTPRTELVKGASAQTDRARQRSRFKANAEFPRPPQSQYLDHDDLPPQSPRAGEATDGDGTPRLPRLGSARGLSTSNVGRDVGGGWASVTRDDVKRRERDRDRKMKGHPPVGEKTAGERQRTHNPSGWCDRDAAHKEHLAKVVALQQQEEEEYAADEQEGYQHQEYARIPAPPPPRQERLEHGGEHR